MAYKNKNKNKKHVRILRTSQGDISVKHYREKERYYKRYYKKRHPHKETTLEELEAIKKERGMI